MKKYIFMYVVLFFWVSLGVLAEPIAIIVNKNNPQTDISLGELNNIYRLKTTKWSHGGHVVPINRELISTSGIREIFSKVVHNKSLDDMQAFWLGQRYKGITPPLTQQSSVAVKRMVNNIDEAIGYIYLSEVDNTIKVLTVDGLSPNDSGYKIKD